MGIAQRNRSGKYRSRPCTMPKIAYYRNYGKTFKKPRRPFEKERLDAELKIVGEYGPRNKRELWRIQMVLSKLRKTARELLTLPDDDPKRIFDSNALMRRMYKYGFLDETRPSLITSLPLRPRTSWRGACRPWSSSWAWPRASTTPGSSSSRGISGSESRSSTSLASLSGLTRRSTLTSA